MVSVRAHGTHPISCALLIALAVAGCARQAPAVAPVPPLDAVRQLRLDVQAAISAPGVQRGVWGIVVESLDRGDRLFELNPGTLLVPASTLKLISVASAVDAVGWDFRYETVLKGAVPGADGVLHGDLIVVGSGDPTIGGRGGAESLSEWVTALKTLGVSKIDGRVVGDDDAIEEPRPQLAWTWDDLGYPTGAIFGALNFAENQMEVLVDPAGSPGERPILSVEPHASSRPLRNRVTTVAPGGTQFLWPEQRPGEPFLSIAGTIPSGAPVARLRVSAGNPTFWFATVLRDALIRGGIEVTGDAYDIDDLFPRPEWQDFTVLYTHRSPTLAEIARPLLKDSINLYGEAALRLNVPPGVFPTNDAALDGLRARLDAWGIPADAWQIVDGSGLSRRNAVSPDVLVAVLRRMYDRSMASPWMTALPIAGRDGTLAGRMQGTVAQDNVRAKTGTMSNIRSLAGYVRTHNDEILAFAIVTDNFEGPGSAALDAIDRIAVLLAAFSRQP